MVSLYRTPKLRELYKIWIAKGGKIMKKVEIYSSDSCGYCHEAKAFFKEQNVEYIEHNISKDMEARKALMKKGYMSVPVIIINEEEFVGFEKDKIASALNL